MRDAEELTVWGAAALLVLFVIVARMLGVW